jgi:hypothetical protein
MTSLFEGIADDEPFRPGGTIENSPAIHRWVADRLRIVVRPGGTIEARAARFKCPYGTPRPHQNPAPSDESLGYYQMPLRGMGLGRHR